MSNGTPKPQPNQSDHLILYNFFHSNLRSAFKDLNLSNSAVLNYIASILTRFARTENLYRIKQIPDFKIESVVETLLDVEVSLQSDTPISENEEALIRKHVGDFTLFMSGIFREYILRLGFLDYYLLEGSRSFLRVYNYAYNAYGNEAEVYNILSRQFELYSGALDYLKKVYFYYPNIDESIKRLLRGLVSW